MNLNTVQYMNEGCKILKKDSFSSHIIDDL